MEIKFKIETDNEGFVSYECPFCESTFSLNADEIKNFDDIYTEMYCPYCGLSDSPSNFYTKEVVEQIQNMVLNYATDEINKAFKKITKSSNKYVKISFKPLKNKNIADIKSCEGTEEIFQCKNCENHIKVDYCVGKSKVYCAYCGLDI